MCWGYAVCCAVAVPSAEFRYAISLIVECCEECARYSLYNVGAAEGNEGWTICGTNDVPAGWDTTRDVMEGRLGAWARRIQYP